MALSKGARPVSRGDVQNWTSERPYTGDKSNNAVRRADRLSLRQPGRRGSRMDCWGGEGCDTRFHDKKA